MSIVDASKKQSTWTICLSNNNFQFSILSFPMPTTFIPDSDHYSNLARQLERVMCLRVHFKIIIIDQMVCYVDSANLTGAGMGMKADTRRYFEAGILTDEPQILAAAIEEFDKVWRGSECQKCKRKDFCSAPIS